MKGLCEITRLGGCSTCAAFQPLQWNDIALELGESTQARDVLTILQTCAQSADSGGGLGRG